LEDKLDLKKEDTVRGTEVTTHLGSWRKYMTEIQVTKDTDENGKIWLNRNKKLFGVCGYLLKCTSKELYNHYDKVEAPLKVDVWTTCAINFNFGSMKSHLDKDDYRAGFCWVIPFGNFTGGELYFKDINVTIQMQPGMVDREFFATTHAA
jgi:hypothetical protein